jgi:predicted DNA-binding WGR domain protein
MRKLTCTEGGSNKFWEGDASGKKLVTRWGRIGTAGQSKTKSFATPAAAQKELDKLVAEKLGKGYVEAAATKAMAPKKAKASTKAKHPFLFYGVSPDDWGEGANCGHVYVLAFRDAQPTAARKTARRAFEKACGKLVDTSCGPWTWEGKHALVMVGEQRSFDDDDEPFEHVDFFAGVGRALVAVHDAAPLAEVVYLNACGPSDGVAWEEWTLATQPKPSAWPDFGHVALYFKAW